MRNILFSVLVLTILGCQSIPKKEYKPDDLMITEFGTTPTSLTKSQVQEDIQFLSYALEKGYGGRKYLPDDSFQRALEQIRKIKLASTPLALMTQIDEALLLVADNHLVAKIDGKKSSGRQNLYNQDGTVGKNAISDLKKTWEVRMDEAKGKKILYISITSFPSSKDKVWEGFFDEVKKRLKKSNMLVLDLRGNGGGDDSTGGSLSALLLGRFQSPYEKQYTSQTPETLMIRSNYPRMAKLADKYKGRESPPYWDELIEEIMSKYQLALEGKLPVENVSQSNQVGKAENGPVSYRKPIYILMDRECASSCESSIDFFEFHPYAKRVGENTGGYIHFGNVGYVILPNSRIDVQIPTHYNEYFDKRFIERVGIKPDIQVPAGTDAYELVKKELLK